MTTMPFEDFARALRKSRRLPTVYGNDKRDLGNIRSYERFLEEQADVFTKVYDLMKNGSYLVVITNNVYKDGRLYPLAFDTAKSLSRLGSKGRENLVSR